MPEEHTPENTNQWIGQWVGSLLESQKVLSLSYSKRTDEELHVGAVGDYQPFNLVGEGGELR